MAKHKAGDLVTVTHGGEPANGRVEAVQENKQKSGLVDVRIDHPNHKFHGAVLTFKANDVKPRNPEKPAQKPEERAEAGS